METIASRVRRARRARGLTQHELDEKADLSLGYSSDIECGRRSPGLTTIRKLASVLNVELGWLIAGTGKRPRLSA